MDISFHSKHLRNICEDQDLAVSKFGESISKSLIDRLADLHAAYNIYDLLVGNPTIRINTDGTEICELQLQGSSLIHFVPNHLIQPINADASQDWKKITRIRIIKIE